MINSKSLKENNLLQALESAQRLFARGEFRKAEHICRDILRKDAENAEAHHILGLIADKTGKAEQAVQFIGTAIAKAPGNAVYFNNLGNAYAHLGKYDSALTAYGNAVKVNPAYAGAFNNMGIAYQETGRTDKAIACFKKALAINQNFPEVYFNLGSALKELGFMEPAISAFRQAIALKGNFAKAHYYLGQSLMEEGLLQEAAAFFKRALRFKPDYSEALYSLANVYRDLDKPEMALATYRGLLKLKPDFYKVYSHISSLLNQRTADSSSAPIKELEMVKALLEEDNLTAEDAIHLHFALGDMYDHCDLYEEAFQHYQAANRIKHKNASFNFTKTARYVEEIITTFSPSYFAEHSQQGSQSSLPVFIVGLPRSGKTLLEKLLATHAQVAKGGELIKLHRLVAVDLPIRLGKKKKYPSYAEDIDTRNILEAAQEYEKVLLSIGGNAAMRVTNTLPYNIFYLGLISLLFPRAKIIYCRRNALDNCLAIYFKFFGKGNQFAYDLQEIGSFYQLFSELIKHWQTALPQKIYEVTYEEMIAEPEETARSLIGFLDLEWDAACSDSVRGFLFSGRDAKGNLESAAIHDRFVGRAQKYKKFLDPLEKSLNLNKSRG